MKKYSKIAIVSVLVGTVSACSPDDSTDPPANNVTVNTTAGSGVANDPTGTTSGSSDSTAGTADSGATDDGSTTAGTGTTDAGVEDPTQGGTITPSGRSELGNPPTLDDPFAEAIPTPDSADPFGALLEIDPEAAIAGGAPTTPKNLRVDLVSNDWAEINWAPSNDDVGVVEYRIYRSDKTDGPMYTVREDQTSPSRGTQEEIDKFWLTTSFIDCNYTRFTDLIHACATNGPSPGDRLSYQVTAVDTDGQESPRSNTITILYHAPSNAPVPKYNDYFKRFEDTFAQDHDLSDTSYFLDKFNMVFEDNFDGPVVDEKKWQTALTWANAARVSRLITTGM